GASILPGGRGCRWKSDSVHAACQQWQGAIQSHPADRLAFYWRYPASFAMRRGLAGHPGAELVLTNTQPAHPQAARFCVQCLRVKKIHGFERVVERLAGGAHIAETGYTGRGPTEGACLRRPVDW